MGISLSDLGLPYSVWNAACAVLFPILAALALFVALRRASVTKKLVTFFVSSAIYVVCAVFLFEFAAKNIGIVRYDLVGFMLSVAAGMLYLELCVLICGAGIMRKRGITANIIFSTLFLSASAIAIYFAEAGVCASCDLTEGTCSAIHRIPFLSALPPVVAESGVELITLALLALFITVYFLCFLANKKPDEIRKDDIERRRMKALASAENEEKEDLREAVQIERCCAYCEYARPLYGDGNNIICDKNGVVDADHVCRAFIYDPLKRAPARPVASFDVASSDDTDTE